MLERDIERKLVQGVKELGGKAYKFISPGNTGVPDRLIVLPGGKIIFAELKTNTGRLSEIQRAQLSQLNALGADVAVVQGMMGVEVLLSRCRKYLEDRNHEV